jgi:hypothetical protein
MLRSLHKLFRLSLVAVLVATVAACSMGGRREVVVADNTGTPMNGVLVIPLYISSFDTNVGIEGKPLAKSSGSEAIVTKLFLFNSGEDIIAKQVPSRGVIVPIPPFAYVGSNNTVYRYLMVKSGYAPVVLTNHDVASRRWKPMIHTAAIHIPGIVQLFLTEPSDQEAIKNLMNATDLQDPIQVRLSPEDAALLKSYP